MRRSVRNVKKVTEYDYAESSEDDFDSVRKKLKQKKAETNASEQKTDDDDITDGDSASSVQSNYSEPDSSSEGDEDDADDDDGVFIASKPRRKPFIKYRKFDGKSPFQNRMSLSAKKPKAPKNDDSSSESDIENYLTHPNNLNLNSKFFKPQKSDVSFEDIEKDIFKGVKRLSDSDDSDKDVEGATVTHSNFEHLQEFTRKMEEAKLHVAKYNAKKQAEENNVDIKNLLAVGEKNLLESPGVSGYSNQSKGKYNSDEFETQSDSEKEDWEEVENKAETSKSQIPKEGVQITLNMPDVIRKKKKGVDMMAALKRRLNSIRKENQVYVHQVSLLCWIAHGNYVNNVLNDQTVLGMALSLLPSQQCYPSDRTDLKYLEQILRWYRKTIEINKNKGLKDLKKNLERQIVRKQADSNKMFVYIFVCILRALGIQCRLVLSVQCEPLKPHAKDLLSVKNEKAAEAKSSSKDDKSKDKKIKLEVKDEKDAIIPEKRKSSVSVKSADKKANNTPSKTSKRAVKSSGDKEEKIEPAVRKKSSQNNPVVVVERLKSDNDKVISTKSSESESKPRTSTRSRKALETKPEESKRATRKSTLNETPSKKTASNSIKPETETGRSTRNAKNKIKDQNGDVKKESNKNEAKSTPKEVAASRQKSNVEKVDEEIDNMVANLESLEKSGSSKSVENKDQPETSTRQTRTSKRKPNLLKIKLPPKKAKKEVPQVDGVFLSSDSESSTSEVIQQVDGSADDSENTSKSKQPNFRNLKRAPAKCPIKNHTRRLKIEPIYKDADSEEDFRSPFGAKNSPSTSKASPKIAKPNQSIKTSPKKKMSDSDSDKSRFFDGKKTVDVRDDIVVLVKKRINEQRHSERKRLSRKSALKEESDDSDYAEEPLKKKKGDEDIVDKVKVKRRVLPKKEIDRRVFENTDSKGSPKKECLEVWVEVFLEAEEKWISADVVHGKVHCIKDIVSKAQNPITYVLSWDNTNRIKDVTKRYCPNWNTVTRKLRADPKWWEATLLPFIGKQTVRDREEDEDLKQQETDEPLPKTISEFKDHPLYVLERHLLKFQAIYPPNAVTLGFIRKEPVYSRDCVYTLHSREIWLKHAKTVKPGEEPYKIVKSRPKYDRLSNTMITDLPLEIFGPWQVNDYEPPTAENGVVPRNAFGNVELFKECMLPKKTVHLRLPGLNKVAKKLRIDCAAAVVGFDFHSGWSHPTFDGFVVCEEFAEVLTEAWHEEQVEAEKREKEKYEKRVFGNWKRIIKACFIRERLKARYNFGAVPEAQPDPNKALKKGKGKKK